jgi:hypothetical protein
MSRLFFKQIADLGPENVEVYWLAGLCEVKDAWFVRTVMRGLVSNRESMVLLPIGFSPLLSLGPIFADGEMLSLPARGILSSATITDVSECEEITSANIPPSLYSFGGKAGVQRLFRYYTPQGEILIPAFELIRYLFLHNRTLANVIIRPGALNLLFHPQTPGYQTTLTLRFTSKIPNSFLSRRFAQEFAWIALDPDARRAWDSVWLQSHGKQYVTFTPPPLKKSVWKFRGIQCGNQWLVLELLHLTGKNQPCDELHYGHPSMKEIIRDPRTDSGKADPDSTVSLDGKTARERIIFDYELDDGLEGAKGGAHETTEDYSKQSDFDRRIIVEKLLIQQPKPATEQSKEGTSEKGELIKTHKKIRVSSGEQRLGAKLPPLEFKLLTPATWDRIGDLEALAGTVKQMVELAPNIRFAMSLCQLKGGRAFSLANRKPRVGLVVTITPPGNPPIVLLDVERTGDVALALVALHFREQSPFDKVETSVKSALDGLVDGGGHWNHVIEQDLSEVCFCERLPKMLTPREKATANGQTTLWAVKLLRRLGLEELPSGPKPR